MNIAGERANDGFFPDNRRRSCHRIRPDPDARLTLQASRALTRGDQTMFMIQFDVCPPRRKGQWMVRVGNSFYGAYLDKEQALLDAVDAAQDTVQTGYQAQV
jgi:hypothetical protein